jgi:molecular chaperone DnaJ
MGTPDYYAALGVARDAEIDAIRSAYRRLALSHHPDRHKEDPDATARFQQIAEAYSVLSDAEKRKKHDTGQPVKVIPMEPGTSVQEFLGGLVDSLFGVKQKVKEKGRDRKYNLEVSLAEVAMGASRVLSLPEDCECPGCMGRGFPEGTVPEFCDRCGGSGALQRRKTIRSVIEACPDCSGRGYCITQPCSICHASGYVETQRQVTIDIPKGVKDGMRLLVRGAGQPGLHGGLQGDLFVHIDLKAHGCLIRQGADIILTRPVTLFDALIGAKIEVPTLTGPVKINLPPGTTDGTVLRMNGYGIGSPDTDKRGDQLVTLRIEIPRNLSEKDRGVLKKISGQIDRRAFPETLAFENDDESDASS